MAIEPFDDILRRQKLRPELLADHARRAHGDELEFLWTKFPDNAV